MLPQHYALKTNCHIMGTAQSGKSKLMEHCFREHVRLRNGVTIVDFHGTFYMNALEYLAFVRPKQKIVLMDLSSADYVRGFNPFALREGDDVSAHVNRITNLLVRPWGDQNTNEMPTYERIAKMLLTFAAEANEPLQHAAKLLEFQNKELRDFAISIIQDDYIRNQWVELQRVKTLSEWHRHVLSTQNRIGRLLASRNILRTIGLKTPGESVADWIDENAIVLVNLKPSPYLDQESGKTFAALLLSEFLNTAMRNNEKPKKHFLYLDEAQAYLTNDAAQMLDQVLKSGLRVTIAHHHMGQFHHDPHLQHSIETNAQIKFVFAGLPIEEAKHTAEEFFLKESNKRWLKETRYRYITDHVEEDYEINSEATGVSELGGESNSFGLLGEKETSNYGSNFAVGFNSNNGVSRGTRYRPVLRKERDGQEDWSRDEKLAKLASRLTSPPQRHSFLKLPGKDATGVIVPFVRRRLLKSDTVLQYVKDHQSTATPSHAADQIFKDQEHAFLERSKDSGATKPKKKSPTLYKQEG
jgi:hypothetical protein